MTVHVLQPAIAAELQPFGPLRPRSGGTGWELRLGVKRCRVDLAEHWLVLDSPAPRNRPRRARRLLERNAELDWNARYILCHDETVRLRSEVPLGGMRRSGAERLRRDLARAVSALAAALGAEIPGPPPPGAGSPEAPLSELLEEAGWPFTESGSDRVSADLELNGGGAFTAVARRIDGTTILGAELARGETSEDSTSQDAVAALLLAASATVPMVSAVAPSPTTEGGAHGVGFRVRLPPDATAEDLGHGLSALSVACDSTGREVRALIRDAELARLYLEVCHPRWLPASSASITTNSEEETHD